MTGALTGAAAVLELNLDELPPKRIAVRLRHLHAAAFERCRDVTNDREQLRHGTRACAVRCTQCIAREVRAGTATVNAIE